MEQQKPEIASCRKQASPWAVAQLECLDLYIYIMGTFYTTIVLLPLRLQECRGVFVGWRLLVLHSLFAVVVMVVAASAHRHLV